MGEGRIFDPGHRANRLVGLLLMVGLFALPGCEGDTLYDPVPSDVDPPDVEVLSPTNGAEIQAGQRLPIQVSAMDEEGISSITLQITGAVTETIVLQFTPPRTEVQADTAVVVPVGAEGNIQISATGLNTEGVQGQAEGVSLSITTVDALAPWVSLSVETMDRMELTDSIRVTVRAFDNPGGSGISSTALTAIVTNTDRADTLVLNPSETFPGLAADTADVSFYFTPPFIDDTQLPDTLHILFFGTAIDREGNCGGSVTESFTDQVACVGAEVGGTTYPTANAVTDPRRIIAVSGRTSLPPGGGKIADILVDTLRSRVYASNLSRNRVQILEAELSSWGPEVWVGSEPWGLAMDLAGDSLLVANSGGTTVSFVSLAGNPAEDLDRRFVTQNNSLFEVELVQGLHTARFYDFSDRPQFIAQDAAGRMLFSTRPTSAAQTGTVRVASTQPGWVRPETKIVVVAEDVVIDDLTSTIAHVDSVQATADGSCVQIWDHRPGFPEIVVTSGCQPLDQALAAMEVHRAAGDTDIWYARNSRWEFDRLALHDTTFVAASGDRQWVAFGEGGTGNLNTGRVTLWNSNSATIHSRLLVADLVNNASERVTGLDLNEDGSLGSASGDGASYFWSTDLRLQGSVTKTIPGGAGAVLHPSLPSFTPGMPSSEQTLAFVGQADYTVRILDTTHFAERGQLHIRDRVTGPLRVGPPLPSDNGGLGASCVGEDCVVLKLYAVTDVGGVVIVDVWRRDIAELQ